METRVRIAPSPSGYLHVGTARTAIFNWLYARKRNGKFLIRIEDTDTESSDPALVDPILNALKWLGMEPDEPIQYQSKRAQLHGKFVSELLKSGRGYRCFCSKEKLETAREKARQEKHAPRYDRACADLSADEIQKRMSEGLPSVVRVRIPDGETVYNDLILGEITRQNVDLDDFVVARADGRALYNFAAVVDDHDMGVTDVIRGNDHITNTFKQIHIYCALGFQEPNFGHVPLLLRPDKRKISKRLGDKDVAEYGADGFLPQAMFNFLCLLGWSPKDGREIMSYDEILDAFSIGGINANNPVFDEQKLIAFNKDHIKTAPIDQLVMLIAPLLVENKLTESDWVDDSTNCEYLKKVIDVMRERLRVVNDFSQLAGFFFSELTEYDPKGVSKRFKPETAELLANLADSFESLEKFDHTSLEAALDSVSEKLGARRADIIHATRLAVSAMTQGPGLFDLLALVGKDRTVTRLRRAIEFIRNMKPQTQT